MAAPEKDRGQGFHGRLKRFGKRRFIARAESRTALAQLRTKDDTLAICKSWELTDEELRELNSAGSLPSII